MTKRQHGCLIALSASGNQNELAGQGLGIEHIEELMIRLAMKLLRDGNRLSFGGTLGDAKKMLTKYLIEAALNWLDEELARKTSVTQIESWPLTNYSAWPYYTMISEEQRAQLVGICRFINIDPDDVDKNDLNDLIEDWKQKPKARRLAADALSAMRKKSAEEADLRIVWGGTIAGSAGWMSGILEEVSYTLQSQKPILICGGFGGCARLLAEYLSDEGAPWPEELSLNACADPARDVLLSDSEKKQLRARFDDYRALHEQFKSELHSQTTVCGLPASLVREGLLEESPRRAVKLARSATQHLGQ